MRRSWCFLAIVASMSFSGPAFGQDDPGASSQFGGMGRMVIGADRLFGFSSFKATVDGKYTERFLGDVFTVDIEGTITGSGFTLVGGPPLTGSEEFPINPFAIPRLTFDYFVIENLSVGGSLGYFSSSGDFKFEYRGGGQTETERGDLDKISGFLVAPRVGYVVPFSDRVGVWLLASLQYIKSTTKSESEDEEETAKIALINATAQALFYLSLGPGIAVIAGPMVDLPVGGSTEVEGSYDLSSPEPTQYDVEADSRFRSVGLSFGVIGYF